MNEIISELQKISGDAKTTFGSLSGEQINWKPSVESWSLEQSFDHLPKTPETEKSVDRIYNVDLADESVKIYTKIEKTLYIAKKANK